MASPKIFVDAGHGGSDPGAVGPTGLREKDVNLAVANKLGALLRTAGLTIAYARTGDTLPSIGDRARAANNFGADWLVSIHCNSDGPTANGTETIVFKKGSTAHRFAEPIQAALIAVLRERNRGIKDLADLGRQLGILTGSRMPAALVELAFISNPATEAKMKSDAWRDAAAWAIFDGIVAFLNLEQPEPPPIINPNPEPPSLQKPRVVISAPDSVEIEIKGS